MEPPETPTIPDSNPNPKSSVLLKQSSEVALQSSSEAKDQLDAMLLGCFSVQKMYGREPDAFDAVTQVFHRVLGKYPAERVLRSFEVWVERSQEFPTPADIVGLIKRNGRPPLSKEMFIGISKKDPELRTPSDWKYLREYEAEMNTETFGSDYRDESKESDLRADNERLRKQLAEQKEEYKRLAELLREERTATRNVPQILTTQEKVTRTVEAMKAAGAPQEDIAEFMHQWGITT